MNRTEIMSLANEIRDEWNAMDNEWIDDKPKKIRWDSHRPGVGSVEKPGGHWKVEIPESYHQKCGDLINEACNICLEPGDEPSDDTRAVMNREKLKIYDWENCEDKAFAPYVIRHLAIIHDVKITSKHPLVRESWDKFFTTYGAIIGHSLPSPEDKGEI